MKLARASGTPGLVALAALAATFASSFAMAEDAGWYGGLNGGQSRAKIDDLRINSGLLNGGFTSTTISNDDRHSGYKIFGGYQLNKNFALEGGYFDLGKFGFTAVTVPTGILRGDIKVRGVNLDALGMLPLTDRFSAFARVGVNYAEAKDTFSGSGLVRLLRSNANKREANVKYGAGLQFAFTERLSMRAEVERYRINDAVGNKGDIDLASLGLVYRFGSNRPTPAYIARASAPEPVTPAQRPVAPEPVVAAPAAQPAVVVPPQPRRVSFSADALFDFDKSAIKPEGKQALDKFAAELRGSKFDVISVTGHTDRIGSNAYNVKLSTRRADVVKNYLVEPAGLPAAKIMATGAGESNPVTKPGDCKGTKKTKALIACLQPDRRVDVEVSASK